MILAAIGAQAGRTAAFGQLAAAQPADRLYPIAGEERVAQPLPPTIGFVAGVEQGHAGVLGDNQRPRSSLAAMFTTNGAARSTNTRAPGFNSPRSNIQYSGGKFCQSLRVSSGVSPSSSAGWPGQSRWAAR